jgi:hypothetical protein
VSRKIGALNTLVRNADGSMNGYNTDWEAAISAIEDGLRKLPISPCTSLSGHSGDEHLCQNEYLCLEAKRGLGRRLRSVVIVCASATRMHLTHNWSDYMSYSYTKCVGMDYLGRMFHCSLTFFV